MSIRGKAAIIGIGEVHPRRYHPNRTDLGLMAEAAAMAIRDAGLQKEDIDGLLTVGTPSAFTETLQIRPTYASGVSMMGASGTSMVAIAAAAITAGLAKYVLCVHGEVIRPRGTGGGGYGGGGPQSVADQFQNPYGPTVAANGWYALVAQRHSYEYGTTEEQRAKVAVDERTNANANPTAIWQHLPITTEDVLNSRMIADPLHLLECVMPVSGAEAYIVTSAERATAGPNKPVYVLGAGININKENIAHADRITTSPVAVSAKRAFEMAGLGPRDMDMISLYDCYTITAMVTLEDAGFVKKGEAGPFYQSTDTTYKGSVPINTHGGQLSFGQPGLAGGMTHVVESVRQMMDRAGDRNVSNTKKLEYCFVNG